MPENVWDGDERIWGDDNPRMGKRFGVSVDLDVNVDVCVCVCVNVQTRLSYKYQGIKA